MDHAFELLKFLNPFCVEILVIELEQKYNLPREAAYLKALDCLDFSKKHNQRFRLRTWVVVALAQVQDKMNHVAFLSMLNDCCGLHYKSICRLKEDLRLGLQERETIVTIIDVGSKWRIKSRCGILGIVYMLLMIENIGYIKNIPNQSLLFATPVTVTEVAYRSVKHIGRAFWKMDNENFVGPLWTHMLALVVHFSEPLVHYSANLKGEVVTPKTFQTRLVDYRESHDFTSNLDHLDRTSTNPYALIHGYSKKIFEHAKSIQDLELYGHCGSCVYALIAQCDLMIDCVKSQDDSHQSIALLSSIESLTPCLLLESLNQALLGMDNDIHTFKKSSHEPLISQILQYVSFREQTHSTTQLQLFAIETQKY